MRIYSIIRVSLRSLVMRFAIFVKSLVIVKSLWFGVGRRLWLGADGCR
jgi:hypothetical protein